jgi:hypothetical protein
LTPAQLVSRLMTDAPQSYTDRYFFTWSEPLSSWQPRHTLFLDSIYLFNPSADVYFIALDSLSEPLPNDLAAYAGMGYSLHGISISIAQLDAAGWWLTPANRMWLASAASADNQTSWPHLKYHMADYLRTFLGWKFGGTFLDTDAIILKRLPEAEFMGLAYSENNADWFLDISEHIYVAPGVARIQRGNILMSNILSSAFTMDTYSPDCFNCVGPMALTKEVVALRALNSPALKDMQLLEPQQLYPYHWKQAADMFSNSVDGKTELEYLRRGSYSVHLFGKVTRHLHADPGSIVHILMEEQNLHKSDRACSIFAPKQSTLISDTAVLRDHGVIRFVDCNTASTSDVRVSFSCSKGQLGLHGLNASPKQRWNVRRARSMRLINELLSRVVYYAPPPGIMGPDTCNFEVSTDNGVQLAVFDVDVLVYSRMVTVITHTHGRKDSVEALHASVQEYFPGTLVYASTDGEATATLPPYPHIVNNTLLWLYLPFDSGLSVARNQLMLLAPTPYVHVIDDDFLLTSESRMDTLLAILHGSSFDIAAPRVAMHGEGGMKNEPAHRQFKGILTVEDSALVLSEGTRGMYEGCEHVDFVPNDFLAKRAPLLLSPWEAELKLGESEEFFLRAQQAGIKVLFCDAVRVEHKQSDWWSRPDTEYHEDRRRSTDYWRLALHKHGLQRLVHFGSPLVDLRIGGRTGN